MIDEEKLIEDILWKVREQNVTSEEVGYNRPFCDKANVIECINNQPKIGGWIPCSERLPEKSGFGYPHVIAFAYEDNGWNMYIAVYDFWEDKKWRQAHGDMEEIYDVSYWMPLPKEPKHE